MHSLRHPPVAASVALGFAFAAAFATPSRADVTYHYTGIPFSLFIDNDPPSGAYTTAMAVDISLTLAQAVPANAASFDVTPDLLTFSFDDGRNVLTSGAATAFLSTDAFGNVTAWTVNLKVFCPPPNGAAVDKEINSTSVAGDYAQLVDCPTASLDAGISNTPGTWSVTGNLETYRYVSPPLASLSDTTPPDGSYTSAMRVEVALGFPVPLPPNLGGGFLTDVIPATFSFADGRVELTSGTPALQVRTDGSGVIVDWNLVLDNINTNPVPPMPGEQRSWIHADPAISFGELDEGCCGVDIGSAAGTGSWTFATTDAEIAGDIPPADAAVTAQPNPSSSATTIRFSRAVQGPARVDIFDVTGRRLRSLLTSGQGPGERNVLWDGRDGEGRLVPGGIYFARVSGGAERGPMTKIVRVR